MPTYRGGKLLGKPLATGEHIDASGGWFDAGDYLKFVETASFTDVMLLYAAREYLTAFSDPTALLAETRHGTDWLLKMWDQNRRVLYFQVGIGDGNGGSVLGDHDLWRLPQADDASHAKPGSPTWFAVRRPVFAANAPERPSAPTSPVVSRPRSVCARRCSPTATPRTRLAACSPARRSMTRRTPAPAAGS